MQAETETPKPSNAPDTMLPSQFVYLKRNELRDSYAKKLGHTAQIVRSSMIIAYTTALDDVIKTLNETERGINETQS